MHLQLLSSIPVKTLIVSPAQVPSPKVKTKRAWADTKITWATTTTPNLVTKTLKSFDYRNKSQVLLFKITLDCKI